VIEPDAVNVLVAGLIHATNESVEIEVIELLELRA